MISTSALHFTGHAGVDDTISMFMANPVFMAGLLACLLDNTMPGNMFIHCLLGKMSSSFKTYK